MKIAQSHNDLLDLDAVLDRSGLEFMQQVLSGDIPGPPISGALNFWLDHVAAGEVRFRGKPLFAHFNPMGTVHGGWYGTVLDSCMSCAVMTTVPKGSVYTTLEYKVNLNRPIPLETEVVATGLVDHSGRTTATAHGEIRGAADNRLYATGSTTCLIMPGRVG